MKAFVTKPGGLALFITGEYKTLKNLVRYGVKPYIKQEVDVEVHWNWGTRFQKPNKVIRITPVVPKGV